MSSHLKTFRFLLITLALFSLGGCAPGPAEKGSADKVGMHIDAILEFAVEHPLDWSKTRQQNRGTGWGEVRWAEPGSPDVYLTITSELLTKEEVDLEYRFNRLVSNITDLEVTRKELLKLADSQALHATGHTDKATFTFYLLNAEERGYTIRFSAPQTVFDQYTELREEILQSFVIL